VEEHSQSGICQRIGQVRLEAAGRRGKASFAKQLGLSPSTYAYYERSRVPPADVLVRIAEVAGVDVRWLLTGEAAADQAVPADHPILRRAAALLAARPNAAGPLAAFLDILAKSLSFPPSTPGADDEPRAVGAEPARGGEGWLPVLGRSAAGVPHFWAEGQPTEAVTHLEELIARHAGRPARRVASGVAREAEDDAGAQTVQLVTLSAPDDSQVAEYVSAPAIKARYPDAFAIRIDGESMAPFLRHGDLAILSPSEPAADGRAAVVQLRRQIGVTCKVCRREGDRLHLVPINEQFAPQSFAAAEAVWALRVLARVRVTP
jgi:transcriptional regulator with XRE-family HTH domain